MKIKKILSMIICLCLIISTFAVSTISAGAETEGDFDYSILDNGTISIDYYNGKASELVIPSEIDGYAVTSISGCAFEYCESLESVTIPNKVKSIGYQAFGGCISLTNITLPDSVNHIGDYAFYGCTSLTSITLPNNVNYIGNWAFKDTGYYNNKANWKNNVLYIDNYLIEAKDISGYYKIKDGTRLIADNAFEDCSITSITIPDSVNYIGNRAFEGCGSLKTVTIPDSVKYIGSWAFEGCRSLKTVTIGNGVTNIGQDAFLYCPSLTSIKVDKNNSNYCDIDGVLFNKSRTKLIQYPIKNKSESYTVPDSVITIDKSAFSNCSSLKTILIGNSVTKIGQSAFNYCTSLTNIKLPNSLKYIGYRAFEDCKALTEMSIPNSVIKIGYHAFENCKALTKIKISNSITKIGQSAFSKCTSLKSVTIPNSVTIIGDSAFSDCTKLKSIKFGKNVKRIGDYAFSNCKALAKISIPNSVTEIDYHAFEDCKSLKSVTIPNSVTKIKSKAFGYYYDSRAFQDKKVKGFTVKGHKGSKAEKYAKDNGMKFVTAHNYKGKVTKPATYFSSGKKVYKCSCGKIQKTIVIKKLQLKMPKVSIKADEKAFTVKYTKVKDATGFEVKYKKGNKWVAKKFKTENPISKTIRKLKKGSYKVQIRAFIQKGEKSAYSKAVTKTVNVK